MKQLELSVPKDDAAARIARSAFAAILEQRKRNPSFRLTEAALGDALRPALVMELPKAKRVAGRNVLFDALAEGCGLTEPFTKSAAGQVAKALKEILEIDPTVSADDLLATAKAVRRKFEDAGPMAVSTHWSDFAAARRHRQHRAQTTAPVGWLEKLNELHPDSTLARGGRFEITTESEYAWGQLDASLRTTLLASLR